VKSTFQNYFPLGLSSNLPVFTQFHAFSKT